MQHECQSKSGERRRKSRSSYCKQSARLLSFAPLSAGISCQPPPCCMSAPCCRTTACGNRCCLAPAAFPERCPCFGRCNNGCCSNKDSDNKNSSSNSLARKSDNQITPKPLKPLQLVGLMLSPVIIHFRSRLPRCGFSYKASTCSVCQWIFLTVKSDSVLGILNVWLIIYTIISQLSLFW